MGENKTDTPRTPPRLQARFGAYPDPEVPLALQMGWKTCIIGFFKVKDTKKEIDKTNIKGFVFQFRIWLPLDGFGIL